MSNDLPVEPRSLDLRHDRAFIETPHGLLDQRSRFVTQEPMQVERDAQLERSAACVRAMFKAASARSSEAS